MKVKVAFKGGPGSGHHGHSGRPGKRGGSQPGSGGSGGDGASDSKPKTTSSKLSAEDKEKALKVIGSAIATRFTNVRQMKYIQYRFRKNSITIQDWDGQYGNIIGAIRKSDIERAGLTMDAMKTFFEAYGMGRIPNRKRRPYSGSSYYD